MAKNITKTIHEAPKFSRLQWALASSAPWFFHESFKISWLDPCQLSWTFITLSFWPYVKLTSNFPDKLKTCFSCFNFIKSSSSGDFWLLILKFYTLLFFVSAEFYMFFLQHSNITGKPIKVFMSSKTKGNSNWQERWTLLYTKFSVLLSDSSSFQCPRGIYESFAHPEWKKQQKKTKKTSRSSIFSV